MEDGELNGSWGWFWRTAARFERQPLAGQTGPSSLAAYSRVTVDVALIETPGDSVEDGDAVVDADGVLDAVSELVDDRVDVAVEDGERVPLALGVTDTGVAVADGEPEGVGVPLGVGWGTVGSNGVILTARICGRERGERGFGSGKVC